MSKSIDNRQKWIITGYELFGKYGPEALNVEKLSNLVELNRSSFYHYFKDLYGFETILFNHHIEQYKSFAQIIEDYVKYEQVLSGNIFDHHGALAFQRQLLINESKSRYKICMDKAFSFTSNNIFELWHSSSLSNKNLETEWIQFAALRDFFYVHYGQGDGNTDLKGVMLRLHNYLDRKS